jgi:hypothetical protein
MTTHDPDRPHDPVAIEHRFVADAAHRLANPLTGARLRLEELARRADSERFGEELGVVLADLDRAVAALDELLHERARHAARLASTHAVDLPALVQRVAARWGTAPDGDPGRLRVAQVEPVLAAADPAPVERVLVAILAAIAVPDAEVEVAVLAAPTFGRVRLRRRPFAGRPVAAAAQAPELAWARQRVEALGGRLVGTVDGGAVDLLLPRAGRTAALD